MLKEAKLAMQVDAEEYEAEIAALLMSAANDLKIAGVVINGDVTFSVANDKIVDNCTVTDELVKRALITYAQANANWQPEAKAARFRASYDEQKTQLMHATGYTDFGESDSE